MLFRARIAQWLGAMLVTASLAGCGQQSSISDPQTLDLMKQRFADGDAMMACGLGCAGNYGFHRQELQQLYQDQDWPGLESRLLIIGQDGDQSWFYLAAAAEGQGYDSAAQLYYFRSLASRFQCRRPLNVCDGLDLPSLTFSQLGALDAKLQQSAAFAPLNPSPAAKGDVAVKLISDHGIMKAPVLLDGTLPLLMTVDSGDSVVTLPEGAVILLVHDKLVQKQDILGVGSVQLGDGSVVPAFGFRIKRLQIGGIVLHDVVGATSPGPGQLLLGQSFLSKFKSWSIDNGQSALVLSR